MSSSEASGAGAGWRGVAATKFIPPRRRTDLVARPALLERLRTCALTARLCLVCAPAGFGKSTLLLQLQASLHALVATENTTAARCVWLSLDEEDNDINRLLVSLLGAICELPLAWEVHPQTLASQVAVAGPQSRAAVAIIVNALTSFTGTRLVLVIDDLHHIRNADVLDFLAALIERLPPGVGMVIGSRSEPEMPLARWRMRGEMGEIRLADLQFTQADAESMALLHGRNVTQEAVTRAIECTEGWVAGLQLVLGAEERRDGGCLRPALDHLTERHLFDFFAQEVLTPLPTDHQLFLLQCSILSELSPPLCNAVTQRCDAQAVLVALYRRNIFLVALDERIPVLRFHDLFADFLRTEMAARHPEQLAELHARAAAAEVSPLRAVTHWLSAGRWREALTCMMACAQSLLAEGGVATVGRWLAELPPSVAAQDPDALMLQAWVVLPAWDFVQASAYLTQAAHRYRELGRKTEYQHCCALLPRLCISAGRLDEACHLFAELENEVLDPPLRMLITAAQAWLAAATVPARCAGALQSLVSQAEAMPSLLPPVVENLFIPHFFGMPGAMPTLRRLRDICRQQVASGAISWQLEGMANLSWPEVWRGERMSAEAALAREAESSWRFAIVPMPTVNFKAESVCLLTMQGKIDEAIHLQRELCETFRNLNPGFSATWLRTLLFLLAHLHWRARDRVALRALWPELATARTAAEWPVIDTFRAQLHGQLALLEGDLEEAQAALQEAVALQATGYLPNFIGDARASLAVVHLNQGDVARAWSIFAPLLEEMVRDDCLGPLLMESESHRQQLIGLIPAERIRGDVRVMLLRLRAWQTEERETPFSGIVPVFSSLTRRERDVLARLAAGDSNAQIAEHLAISLNTVKRHVGNLLAKLDCKTRGQVAARWRSVQH